MLWTFGCSHTAGHGLPDCVDLKDLKTPIPGVTSKMGWPAHLARLMGEPLTNLGVGGVGVRVAWHRAVNAPVQPGDTVVIMWPCWESRIDILDDPDNVTHPLAVNHDGKSIAIRSWYDNQLDYFEKYYTLYDQWTMWHLHMTHVHYHFNVLRKNDNIRLIQTTFARYSSFDEYLNLEAPDFSNFDITVCHFGHRKYTELPLAVDNSHNGLKANELFAQELYAEMQRKSLN